MPDTANGKVAWILTGLAGVGLLGERRYLELNGWAEPEPRIPTVMDDWDAEFLELTGQRIRHLVLWQPRILARG